MAEANHTKQEYTTMTATFTPATTKNGTACKLCLKKGAYCAKHKNAEAHAVLFPVQPETSTAPAQLASEAKPATPLPVSQVQAEKPSAKCNCGASIPHGETVCETCQYANAEPQAMERAQAENRAERETANPQPAPSANRVTAPASTVKWDECTGDERKTSAPANTGYSLEKVLEMRRSVDRMLNGLPGADEPNNPAPASTLPCNKVKPVTANIPLIPRENTVLESPANVQPANNPKLAGKAIVGERIGNGNEFTKRANPEYVPVVVDCLPDRKPAQSVVTISQPNTGKEKPESKKTGIATQPKAEYNTIQVQATTVTHTTTKEGNAMNTNNTSTTETRSELAAKLLAKRKTNQAKHTAPCEKCGQICNLEKPLAENEGWICDPCFARLEANETTTVEVKPAQPATPKQPKVKPAAAANVVKPMKSAAQNTDEKVTAKSMGIGVPYYRILRALHFAGYDGLSYRGIEKHTGYYAPLTAWMRPHKEGSLGAMGLTEEFVMETENSGSTLMFRITEKGEELLVSAGKVIPPVSAPTKTETTPVNTQQPANTEKPKRTRKAKTVATVEASTPAVQTDTVETKQPAKTMAETLADNLEAYGARAQVFLPNMLGAIVAAHFAQPTQRTDGKTGQERKIAKPGEVLTCGKTVEGRQCRYAKGHQGKCAGIDIVANTVTSTTGQGIKAEVNTLEPVSEPAHPPIQKKLTKRNKGHDDFKRATAGTGTAKTYSLEQLEQLCDQHGIRKPLGYGKSTLVRELAMSGLLD